MEFPLYRKYANDLSFFLIKSPNNFIEYKKNSTGIEIHKIEAKILPDRNFIQDMIELKGEYWEVSSKSELDFFLKNNSK